MLSKHNHQMSLGACKIYRYKIQNVKRVKFKTIFCYLKYFQSALYLKNVSFIFFFLNL